MQSKEPWTDAAGLSKPEELLICLEFIRILPVPWYQPLG